MRRAILIALAAVAIFLLGQRTEQLRALSDDDDVVVQRTMVTSMDPATRRLLVRYQTAAAACDKESSR